MADLLYWSGTVCRRCWRNGSTAWLWVTRTFNDHEQLRSDPLLGLLSGERQLDKPLAGKSTLNRLELTGRSPRYHKISYSAESMDRLLTDLFLESHSAPPEQIVLLAAVHLRRRSVTVRAVVAGQPGRGFRFGRRGQPHREQLRERWPEVSIVLRADSRFCREDMMNWCESNHVDYPFGLAQPAAA